MDSNYDADFIKGKLIIERKDFMVDLSFSLKNAGISVVFGPSGCGKTTLLRGIAGLEPKARGFLKVGKEDWLTESEQLPSHKRNVAYVFQEPRLFEHLTVRQNIEYGMNRAIGSSFSKKQASDLFTKVISTLELTTLLERKTIGLSGGEQQRVAIARAICTKPDLLLMDEPLSALDYQLKSQIIIFIKTLATEIDIPIIYVTHSTQELAQLADYVLLMDKGKCIDEGSVKELLFSGRLNVKSQDDYCNIVDGLVLNEDKRWHLTEVSIGTQSLWIKTNGCSVGSPIRLQVMASDISISLQDNASSAQNSLSATIVDFQDDTHPSTTLVTAKVDNVYLRTAVTKRAIDNLQLSTGSDVRLNVKTVAVL